MKLASRAVAVLLGLALLNSANAQDDLENSSWQLVAIHSFNDSVFIPDEPENYLLRFRMENRLQVEADCNQAGATWEIDGESLSITALVTTRKLCNAPSLFNRYIMTLQQTSSVTREADTLILHSSNGVDWMEFEPYVFTPTF
jgi:heat shock protein HslJ